MMRKSKHRFVWLVLLLLAVGGLQPVFGWSVPWEITRWKNTQKQEPLRELMVQDFAEMSSEAKFWFVRGYLLSSWYWVEMEQQQRRVFIAEQMKWFWPVNEQAMVGYMIVMMTDPVWKKQPMYSGFPDGWIYYRRTGQITFQGEK